MYCANSIWKKFALCSIKYGNLGKKLRVYIDIPEVFGTVQARTTWLLLSPSPQVWGVALHSSGSGRSHCRKHLLRGEQTFETKLRFPFWVKKSQKVKKIFWVVCCLVLSLAMVRISESDDGEKLQADFNLSLSLLQVHWIIGPAWVNWKIVAAEILSTHHKPIIANQSQFVSKLKIIWKIKFKL